MLKNIDPVLGPELLAVLRGMGHGDEIAVVDGNYPAETDALAEALGGVDGVLICPAFFEGGRVTAGDVHFVRDGDRYVPAAETEFARDATF